MEQPRELTLNQLKEELVRVKQAKAITEEYIARMKEIPKETIVELTILKRNLDLLDDFKKLENKSEYAKNLEQREKDFNKAIKFMEENNKEIYNPLEIEWIRN